MGRYVLHIVHHGVEAIVVNQAEVDPGGINFFSLECLYLCTQADCLYVSGTGKDKHFVYLFLL